MLIRFFNQNFRGNILDFRGICSGILLRWKSGELDLELFCLDLEAICGNDFINKRSLISLLLQALVDKFREAGVYADGQGGKLLSQYFLL